MKTQDAVRGKRKQLVKEYKISKFRLCLFHVSDFPENTYFLEILFSEKENIFKCLVAF